MRTFIAILAALFLTACQTTQDSNSFGGEQPNILVMGEDAGPDTVPRGNQVFKRVLDALADELNDEGFNVYDETAVSLDHFAQGRARRTDAEIIDVVRSIQRPPIDVAVIYAIYLHARGAGHTGKLYIRVAGRLLNVRNGRRLGSFELEPPQPSLVSPSCDEQCLLETVSRNAGALARDLGAVLAAKLDRLATPERSLGAKAPAPAPKEPSGGLATAYTLVFTGFAPREMTEIEDRITAFTGYQHHRPIKSALRSHEYWYETSSASARLNRNLRHMLEAMDMQARLTFGGNQFRMEKIGARKQR
jgi:hypothetical protein